ncbi:MAG: radical SAM family heme chaperone HemW [Aeromicrobium sp.]|uniref:radical SAM family heme chaperone HemW n=1 Tax=Aeromicrobium sp. TaxID=1871063 RepID=UPI003C553E02
MNTSGRPLSPSGERPFGIYVHVPFCSVRCGYCDFNTYTADELGEGATRATYADTAIAEIERAHAAMGDRQVDTVFFGGGTPTQLPADDLVRVLRAIDDRFGLTSGAEVTTEANPDSVDPRALATLRAGGFNRISFGVQSAVPHVLATLDRTHRPERVPEAVQWAREAGFAQLSVDLIYGTPGESLDDWRASLEHALALQPDHVSAYALIVEDGTAFARQVRRGEVEMPDEDETADKYLLADDLLTEAGFGWYELSNWARDETARCQHNGLYWNSDDWFGIGPGAHSHVAGERWWNVKHPVAYAQRLAAGESPRMDGEFIDADTAQVERVMLQTRLRSGHPVTELSESARNKLPALVGRDLITLTDDRLVLTLTGRLLADAVVRELT